jgi:hypothetical protein
MSSDDMFSRLETVLTETAVQNASKSRRSCCGCFNVGQVVVLASVPVIAEPQSYALMLAGPSFT